MYLKLIIKLGPRRWQSWRQHSGTFPAQTERAGRPVKVAAIRKRQSNPAPDRRQQGVVQISRCISGYPFTTALIAVFQVNHLEQL